MKGTALVLLAVTLALACHDRRELAAPAAGPPAFLIEDGRFAGGHLGDGSTTNRLVPTPVAGGLTFTALSADDATCGVTTSGAVYCWGDNGVGQLGDGTTTNRLVPTAVAFPSALPPYSCNLEPSLHSIEGIVLSSIPFVNQTAGPVTVYWLNYQGQRVFYEHARCWTVIRPAVLPHSSLDCDRRNRRLSANLVAYRIARRRIDWGVTRLCASVRRWSKDGLLAFTSHRPDGAFITPWASP